MAEVEEEDDELLSVLMLFSDSVLLVVELDEAEVWNGFMGVFVGGIFPAAAALRVGAVVDAPPEEFKEGPSSDLRKKSIKSLNILKLGSTINSIKLIWDSGIRTVFLSHRGLKGKPVKEKIFVKPFL